ncbi:hypothetical protein DCAR_0729068 [Daucus carota subsp. sativus]|uniref:Ethylene insensitive 3-like DNA-binding domain-containing protein n=1 Tax=Daucus carota subsp. sativus TaxID=79200 RepID=A0AAF0XKU2_DAUCS|nr:hypothetical protein DCAR_0729068 [Daucus carota subsp. sativus]
MGDSEGINFYGNLGFLRAPVGEGGVVLESEHEKIRDDDSSDEEIDVNELQKRMWRDRILLQRLKAKKGKEVLDSAKQRWSQEQARRKKMSRAQDGILKYMLEMMEVCNAQGFVYGIIPEKGKPVIGASDNLRAWWKDKVKFDRNGPAAIAKYQADNSILGKYEDLGLSNPTSDYDVDGVEDIQKIDVEKYRPRDANLLDLGTAEGLKNRSIVPPLAPFKGELADGVIEFVPKINPPSNAPLIAMGKDDHQLGFYDRNLKNNHQISCPRRIDSSQGLSVQTLQINNVGTSAFSMPSAQLNPTDHLLKNPAHGDDYAVGLPDDGKKMISELMSFYDSHIYHNQVPDNGNLNILGDRIYQNQNLNNGDLNILGDHVHQNQNLCSGDLNILGDNDLQQQTFKLDDNLFGQGTVMGGNISEETNMPLNQSVFPSTDFQFGQHEVYDSIFDSSPNENPLVQFSSPSNLAATDYDVDSFPEHDGSLWKGWGSSFDGGLE